MSKKVKSVLSGMIILGFVIYMVVVVNILPDSNAVKAVEASEDETVDVMVSEDAEIEQYIKSYIETMTLREKVCQMFVSTPSALTGVKNVVVLGETTKSILMDYPIGGLVYNHTNVILEEVEKYSILLEETFQFMEETKGVSPFMFEIDEDWKGVTGTYMYMVKHAECNVPTFTTGFPDEFSQDVHGALVKNVIDESVDSVPLCFSQEYVGGLRSNIAADDIIMTDMLMSYTELGEEYPVSNAVAAIKAGCDVIQTSYLPVRMIEGVEQAVVDGIISEEQINTSVYRVLKLKYEVGIFNQE